MQGRLRDRTRPQAQFQPRYKQDSWGGGLNEDTPQSKIKLNELPVLENFVPFPDYIEGRSGSQKYTDTALPGSGTIYARRQHATTKKVFLARGGKFYLSTTAAMSAWTEIKEFARANVLGTHSGDTGSRLSGFTVTHPNSTNTNAGTLYWSIVQSGGATSVVSLYKASDFAAGNLVAQGTLTTGTGLLRLTQQNASGLGAEVTILLYSAGTDQDVANTLVAASGTLVESSASDTAYVLVKDYKNDFVVYGTNNLYYIDTTAVRFANFTSLSSNTHEGYTYGSYPFANSGSEGAATPYGRRYAYCFSRIVDSNGAADSTKNRITGNIMLEGPGAVNVTDPPSGQLTDFGEAWTANPIDSTNTNTLSLMRSDASHLVGFNSAGWYTHVSIYATLDIGSAHGVDPITGSGNNKEEYVWLDDVEITATSYVDKVTDKMLLARIEEGSYALHTRFWRNLIDTRQEINAAGDTAGDVTPNFVFAAFRGKNRICYGQLTYPRHIGFFNPTQILRADDGVQEIRKVGENIAIFCNRMSYLSHVNITEQSGTLESIFYIQSFMPISFTVGISDWGSIAEIDQGVFIAHCSDHTIRMFNQTGWQPSDLAGGKLSVSTIRKIIVGSSAAYFAGAYFLWYRTSSSDSYNTNCLRLGLRPEAGYGWSRYTGASWVFPPLYVGGEPFHDANNVQRLLAVDYTDAVFYWIETFDGYTGAGLTRYFKDKVAVNGSGGTDPIPKVRIRRLVGEEESNACYLQQTHIYTKPSASSYPSGFSAVAKFYGYRAGALYASDTQSGVSYTGGDIEAFSRIEGNQIQVEIEFETSGVILTSLDVHYTTTDRKAIGDGPAETLEAGYQAELAQGLKHWLSRPKMYLDRSTGLNFTLSGTAPTFVTGPDGKTYGLSFAVGSFLSTLDVIAYNTPTIMFWIKGSPAGSNAILVGSGTQLIISFPNSTTIRINNDAATDTTLSDFTSTWTHIAIRYGTEPGALFIYQNGVYKSSVSITFPSAGTIFSIRNGGNAFSMFDVRVYNKVITAAAIAYYYNDVATNTGLKVLPIA